MELRTPNTWKPPRPQKNSFKRKAEGVANSTHAELEKHSKPADVGPDLTVDHGHHGNGRGGGEPVRFVVATGVVAHFVG